MSTSLKYDMHLDCFHSNNVGVCKCRPLLLTLICDIKTICSFPINFYLQESNTCVKIIYFKWMHKILRIFCTKVKVSIKQPSVSQSIDRKRLSIRNSFKSLIFDPFTMWIMLNITGDYLGEKNDLNEQVLKAFVELHDFTNLILVQALR